MSHIRLPPGSVTSEKCFQEFPQHSVGGSTTTIESYWFNLPIQNCPALRSPLRHNISSDPAAAAAAKSLQSCLTLCDPIDSSPPGSLVPGILRQEHWSGLPFPSPMHESEKWKWSHSVVSDSATPWTTAHQAPPSTGFSRQEHCSGVPLPSLPLILRPPTKGFDWVTVLQGLAHPKSKSRSWMNPEISALSNLKAMI